MNLLDAIILLPIAYFAYRGFRSGLVHEFFGIFGIILAVFFTFEYMGAVAGIFAPLTDDRDSLTIITGFVMFIITVALVQYCAYGLTRFLNLIRLGILNRIAGSIFGGLKSAILISAALLLFTGIDIPDEETRNESASYHTVVQVAPITYDIVGAAFPGVKDFVGTIERALEENNPIRTLPNFEKLDL